MIAELIFCALDTASSCKAHVPSANLTTPKFLNEVAVEIGVLPQ